MEVAAGPRELVVEEVCVDATWVVTTPLVAAVAAAAVKMEQSSPAAAVSSSWRVLACLMQRTDLKVASTLVLTLALTLISLMA